MNPTKKGRDQCELERSKLQSPLDVPGRREDTHQLFVRSEWRANFELDVQVGEIDEVGSERREVVGIVPLPRRCALEVILQNPAESLDIRFDDAGRRAASEQEEGS